MWAIWTSRNNVTHDRDSLDPTRSMKMIIETLSLLEIPQHHARILRGHGWRPPEDECIKINTDAGISMEARRCGLGGVVKSPDAFVAAWCKPVQGVTDPLVPEALALREGVVFAQLRGFVRVEMETDNLEVVNL